MADAAEVTQGAASGAERASAAASYALLLIFTALLVWGVLGFVEYLFGLTLIAPLQNANFPPAVQFMHWAALTTAGTIYLAGYALRWRQTPFAMIAVFAMLWTMCVIETFDFMTAGHRYLVFVAECILYPAIAAFLLKSRRMIRHFGGDS
ncbi:MAG: hypothetical protein AAF666_11380 [Pseudomonadota bacterium]